MADGIASGRVRSISTIANIRASAEKGRQKIRKKEGLELQKRSKFTGLKEAKYILNSFSLPGTLAARITQ
jgi:hypothetical protein